MKIRALRTIRTDIGNVRRGDITTELSDTAAKSLIKRGLAELVDEPEAEATLKHQPAEKPKTPAKPKGAKSSPETGAKAPEGD